MGARRVILCPAPRCCALNAQKHMERKSNFLRREHETIFRLRGNTEQEVDSFGDPSAKAKEATDCEHK